MGERARVCESVVNWKFRSGAVELDMAVNSVKEEEESKEHWTTMRGNVQRKALREDISTKGVTCDWRQQEVKESMREGLGSTVWGCGNTLGVIEEFFQICEICGGRLLKIRFCHDV